jgi:UDP-glucose 4-epimerase
LDALAPESTIFANCPDDARYKAYNLGKGKGMSVLQIVEAMRHATGFDYKYEIIGRRYVISDHAPVIEVDTNTMDSSLSAEVMSLILLRTLLLQRKSSDSKHFMT